MILDLPDVFRFAVGRQAHDLVLARIDLEARIVSKSRIEQAEGMGEVNFFQHRQAVAATQRERSGGPFSYAVHGQHRSVRERRGEEGARRMTEMMFGKQQPLVPVYMLPP